MRWRPKNWKKLEIKQNPIHCFAPEECVNQAYEKGADAMYKTMCDEVKKLEERILALEEGLPGLVKTAEKIVQDMDATLNNLAELKKLLIKLVIGKDTNRN